MKRMIKVPLPVVIASVVACSKSTTGNVEEDDPFPITYENELLSNDMPKG